MQATSRVQTQVRMDRDLHQRLRDEADRRGVSVNKLINKAVDRWVWSIYENWSDQATSDSTTDG